MKAYWNCTKEQLEEMFGFREKGLTEKEVQERQEKYGKNKYIWDNNVADYILLKSNEEYFNDPLCKNGYFRGVETFKFVKEVISRGEVYKSKIKH